ncbi:hypothetical protein [Agromyces sp. ZXT2-6]|uniref:hypothetical protein n=1 Tax=Agromyces sp. ZXT2-6 TaxID=3461153 RepID=UPI00405534DF
MPTSQTSPLSFSLPRLAEVTIRIPDPISLEFYTPGAAVETVTAAYDDIVESGSGMRGSARVAYRDWEIAVDDEWTAESSVLRVHRSVRVLRAGTSSCGLRATLAAELDAAGERFDAGRYYAPPALYNLNDIDEDGLEDYVDGRELLYRDDRLTALSVLAYFPRFAAGIALVRTDLPEWDDAPERARGELDFLQATDVGSLGVAPTTEDLPSLVAAHPFVERSRSHALTARGREPWGAFHPLSDDTSLFDVSYEFRAIRAETDIDALWQLWSARMRELDPQRVELPTTLDEITYLRVEALLPYYAEGTVNGEPAAGFVTNCHPQDGIQLGNIIQYGFTGQNVLNALHALNHSSTASDPEAREKGLRVIDFFASQALRSPFGLTPTLYDLEHGRTANWWSGLILPLAYAEEGDDLEELMGPVYEHMKYAIEPLQGLEGTYLRCMAEEHTALLRSYRVERDQGVEHDDWLEAAVAFGDFLVSAQEEDGTWRRAYGFDGSPLIEPRKWFGLAELNQKSSTATAVPFLVALYEVTGDARYLESARRAERFTAARFVRDVKFNGGIHDSIYARAQLVDSESILFCLRASLAVWRSTDDADALRSAVDAARLLATWVYLWDVPLPPSSTLAGFGFRTTGWSACDTSGAGYIHPYELHAVPDLFEVAMATGDEDLARIADLVMTGSSANVETPAKSWGYARPGLQEEGVLVSWWMIDDPMFEGTHFGGRGKGEGNKTCLPWISAVGIDAHDLLAQRYGTSDLREYWRATR